MNKTSSFLKTTKLFATVKPYSQCHIWTTCFHLNRDYSKTAQSQGKREPNVCQSTENSSACLIHLLIYLLRLIVTSAERGWQSCRHQGCSWRKLRKTPSYVTFVWIDHTGAIAVLATAMLSCFSHPPHCDIDICLLPHDFIYLIFSPYRPHIRSSLHA